MLTKREITMLSKNEIKKIRHKCELPLLGVCVFINIIAIAVLVDLGIMMAGDSDNAAMAALNEVTGGVNPILLIFFTAALVILAMHRHNARTRSKAVRVSENNFPEIYNKSVEFSIKLGLKTVPPVYIAHENGIVSAFAASIIGRRYIQLNAEIVDIAYMEHRDFNVVYFVLGHEFGHIYFKHTTPAYHMETLFSKVIPILGTALSRAQEYSCDRISQLLNEGECVNEAMTLCVGRHLYKYVDTSAYLADAKKEKGIFLWFVNLMEDHPINSKRIAAIADPERKSGKLF